MLKPPDMPSGHRRSRSGSYFSGFKLSSTQFQGQTTPKSKSTEKLSELQLDAYKRAHSVSRNLSPEEDSLEACKVRIEQELELQVQSLQHKNYKEVTIPTSIKFSIKRQASAEGNAMARPSDTDFLDQTLLNIRKKLNALSNDRLEMESKMEDLMNGIKAVHLQYHDHQMYKRHQSMPNGNSNVELYASIRRARSNAAKRPSNLSITAANASRDKAVTAAEGLSQDADTPDTVPTPDMTAPTTTDLSQSSISSSQASSCTYPSPPMLRLSPSSSSSPPLRQRSMSATATSGLRFRPSKPSLFSVQTATSCGNIEEIPTTTIHELPESPTFVSTTSLLSASNCSLHNNNNNTTTTTTGNYRRSLSVSSPPATSSATLSRSPRLTSTPNVYLHSSGSDKRDCYHTLPNMSHKNSHSDNNVMNTTIPEGEVDTSSITDSLSQLSTCTDEGSPKNSGSTIVVRRSSLTGQIEHYRKPRLTKKSSSSSQVLQSKDLKQKEAVQSRMLSPSRGKGTVQSRTLSPSRGKGRDTVQSRTLSPSRGKDVEFRVLNKGVRKSRNPNRASKIIFSSIETTV